MNSTIRISILEVKQLFKRYGIWSSLFIAVLYTITIYLKRPMYPTPSDLDTYFNYFGDISYYIILIMPSFIMSREFSLKTSRIIFTGSFSRINIVLSKLLSLILIGCIVGTIHRLLANLLWILEHNKFTLNNLTHDIFTNLTNYILISFFVSSLSFIIGFITFSQIATIVSIISMFSFESMIRGIILIKLDATTKLALWIKENPLALVYKGMQYNNLSMSNNICLALTGLVLFLIALIIINKREI
ncbi:hypothetical protein M5J14_20530 [Lysinibacillus sp. OL1_EC]|uniref:hypothetical protein n=1 Tax=unclassified Lysinibacillus TaxID=2636778 RepID=UPI001038A967|nr:MULTISPECIES: hypothetical protein [unclassified Lysinibacillus]MCM0626888.1 hypothetical protein [Lysinibacillus sp. OL1_EC]TBV85581.1 hypothetical protein EW028_20650 [Lysinibacillus sp. OL1]WGT40505.1 hypothetical protein QH639_06975 [Lysinibacillus sp. 1 U-2021]